MLWNSLSVKRNNVGELFECCTCYVRENAAAAIS